MIKLDNGEKRTLKHIAKIIALMEKDMGHLTTPELVHILEGVEKHYMDKAGWKWQIKRELRCMKSLW